MQHDRARLEQREIAFLIGWNLPERTERAMRRLLHLAERDKTNVIRLAHFLERPANAHVTRQTPAAVRRAFKGCDGGGHWKGSGSWHDVVAIGIRFSRLVSAGRTTGAAPDNLPCFLSMDFAFRT